MPLPIWNIPCPALLGAYEASMFVPTSNPKNAFIHNMDNILLVRSYSFNTIIHSISLNVKLR